MHLGVVGEAAYERMVATLIQELFGLLKNK